MASDADDLAGVRDPAIKLLFGHAAYLAGRMVQPPTARPWVIFAIIDPRNQPSQNVARKLGFTYWKQAVVAGYLDNLYRLTIGPPAS